MENLDLAPESEKIKKLRIKLKQKLNLKQQRALERAMKNQTIKAEIKKNSLLQDSLEEAVVHPEQV